MKDAMERPSTWPVRPLRAIAEVRLGRQRSPDRAEGPNMVPYLRAANVKDGRLDLSDIKEMDFTPAEQSVFALKPGDVLVTEGAGSLAAVGASAAWNGEIDGMVCFQNTLLRLRPTQGNDSRFLMWWARHAYWSGLFAAAAGGANIYHLGAETIRTLPAPIPPLREQRAIADYLDAETARIDGVARLYERRVGALLEERMSATHSGVSGASVESTRKLSSLTWLTDVPTHWHERKLTLLAKLGSGHTPSRQHPEWWTDSTIPWITTGEVHQIREDRVEYVHDTRELISETGLANSAAELHPEGTVVLSRTASAGFSAIMGTDMATSQDYVTWTCGPRLRPRYLLLCLRAMRKDLLERLAMGSTHKTIYVPDIQSIRVPVPPLWEQDRIVEWTWQRLRAIDKVIDATRQQIDLLMERRQALITAAVTGQIEIPGVAA